MSAAKTFLSPPGHEMVLASAGTGKTYQLTNRYVSLLLAGVPPERILALTFTNKAAGEFFEKILAKLCAAAADNTAAQTLSADLGATGVTAADYRRLLRLVLDRLPRLGLLTLDSFFMRLARAFPLELGLNGPVAILDAAQRPALIQGVYRGLFQRHAPDAAALAAFGHAFKLATFGRDEKNAVGLLDDFITENQALYLACPDGGRWGNAALIWPSGVPWKIEGAQPAAEVALIRAAAAQSVPDKRFRAALEKLATALEAWTPGADAQAILGASFIPQLLANPDTLARGEVAISYYKNFHRIDAALGMSLDRALRAVVWDVLARRLATTQGLHALVHAYEQHYDASVRRAGWLTFGDITRLLAPGADDHTRPPTAAADPAARLLLDYRLDAAFDHWLFDEFQDTSRAQWNVVANLVDEVVQDDSGRRTFFCVGDVKQAIYAWREGDERLFHEIFERYPRAIHSRALSVSHRSVPPVLDAVNAVFGDPALLAALFSSDISKRWTRGWVAHESAAELKPKPGQAALLLAGDDDETGAFAVTLELLRAIAPLSRGLSVAVLMLKNEPAAALADYLRAHEPGLPVTTGATARIGADNAFAALIVSLLQSAAHPADTLARGHLRLAPLAGWIAAHAENEASLAAETLACVHARGFEALVRLWQTRLAPRLAAGDTFTPLRAEQLAEAARQFDAAGSRQADDFLAFLAHYEVREPGAEASVQILTVHKAKGLDYDVVILPEFREQTLFKARAGLAQARGPDGEIRWILDLPPADITALDPVLQACRDEAGADSCYENLCLLYVAMTRAKRSLYLVAPPPPQSARDNHLTLLHDALAGDGATPISVRVGEAAFDGFWSAGDSAWFAGLRPASTIPAGAQEPPAAPLAYAAPGWPRLRLRRPSDQPGDSVPGAALFSAHAATVFGAAVHEAFAQIEWLADPTSVSSARAPAAMAASEEVRAEIDACLRAPEIARLFARARPAAEVWRERAFELLLGDELVSGVFDRVLVERDATGRATAATVVDFKTDRLASPAGLDEAAARHRPQLDRYREALAHLLGLPAEKISATVVFTHLRRAVAV